MTKTQHILLMVIIHLLFTLINTALAENVTGQEQLDKLLPEVTEREHKPTFKEKHPYIYGTFRRPVRTAKIAVRHVWENAALWIKAPHPILDALALVLSITIMVLRLVLGFLYGQWLLLV